MKKPFAVALMTLAALPALAGSPARDTILAGLATEAKKADPSFAGFSADRGASFFGATQKGGKPDTPSCTSCHGTTPEATGTTRAGKPVEPLAVSKVPTRYTDPEKVAKWFQRNCTSVLGRECTALEKGDFITFMATR
ncbi:MAG: DUF1924 domain-containing protein [Magnetospirillum sp. WYHS-4]